MYYFFFQTKIGWIVFQMFTFFFPNKAQEIYCAHEAEMQHIRDMDYAQCYEDECFHDMVCQRVWPDGVAVHRHENGMYFYFIETGECWGGPYASYDEANKALGEYIDLPF